MQGETKEERDINVAVVCTLNDTHCVSKVLLRSAFSLLALLGALHLFFVDEFAQMFFEGRVLAGIEQNIL